MQCLVYLYAERCLRKEFLWSKNLWENHSFRHSQCTLVYQHSRRSFLGDLFNSCILILLHLLGALSNFLMCVIPWRTLDLMSSKGLALSDTERSQYSVSVSPTALWTQFPEVWQALARKTDKSSSLTLCKLRVTPFLSQQGSILYCRKITKGNSKKILKMGQGTGRKFSSWS